jgi:hypothetical protein
MTNWAEFAKQAPELASFGEAVSVAALLFLARSVPSVY